MKLYYLCIIVLFVSLKFANGVTGEASTGESEISKLIDEGSTENGLEPFSSAEASVTALINMIHRLTTSYHDLQQKVLEMQKSNLEREKMLKDRFSEIIIKMNRARKNMRCQPKKRIEKTTTEKPETNEVIN